MNIIFLKKTSKSWDYRNSQILKLAWHDTIGMEVLEKEIKTFLNEYVTFKHINKKQRLK